MRRVLAAAMAALLLLTAAGCAALFDKEVYTEEPYEVPSEASEPEKPATSTRVNSGMLNASQKLMKSAAFSSSSAY